MTYTPSTTSELAAPIIIDQPSIKIPLMKKPKPLLTDHYQLNIQSFEYLQESNQNFFVVGIIGAQGTGKSTLLNMLCTDMDDSEEILSNPEEYYFCKAAGVFPTKHTKEQIFSSMPTTEGIQMFITKDRTILLDCSPVLCNPYKKDYVINEIDDLKMIIFLMSVCNLLIVVQEDMMNPNILRLLYCAEMMKPTLDRDAAQGSNQASSSSSATTNAASGASGTHQTEEYLPKILFVKNMASARDFLPSTSEKICRFYKYFFKQSKLRIFSCNTQSMYESADDEIGAIDSMHSKKLISPRFLNYFQFPFVQSK